MTEEQWEEVYPKGTREWSTRRMPREHLMQLKTIAGRLEISLAYAHALCLGKGIEEMMGELISRG